MVFERPDAELLADTDPPVPGAMLARRAGNAWIVVRAGPPDVRRRLLAELRARLR